MSAKTFNVAIGKTWTELSTVEKTVILQLDYPHDINVRGVILVALADSAADIPATFKGHKLSTHGGAEGASFFDLGTKVYARVISGPENPNLIVSRY
ncbi:hypothetical protein NKJ26_03320 [Mesorhizobium sp. M0152]|uniref:hypothetical protein n=1 Tax=Mesorhizobium sp. M0152 TaxID=2956898 RepID=UPI00333D58D7